MDFKVEDTIKSVDVAGLLASAFEGGVGYWCQIVDYVTPAGEVTSAFEFGDKEATVFPHIDYPLNEGGAVICRVVEDDHYAEQTFVLNREAIQRGLGIMRDKYPHHWGAFISEDYDAWTGDVFLQCCFFGESVFG